MTTKLAALAVASAVFGMLACATRARGVEAPVDLVFAPIGTAKNDAGAAPDRSRDGRCTLRLVASRIEKSSPGCYLDEQISGAPGMLLYACSGDGPAEAEFGDQHYVGKVEGGELQLELATELDWEDGCRWGTRAQIQGSLTNRGEPTLQKLSWAYLDRIVAGSGCSGTCSAKASIAVVTSRGALPSVPRSDEDDLD